MREFRQNALWVLLGLVAVAAVGVGIAVTVSGFMR